MSATNSYFRSMPCNFFASILLFVLLIALLAPALLWGQAQTTVRTIVTPTPEGARATTTVADRAAGFHPSRALVRFRRGVRELLPGSGAARPFDGDPDLFLVPNPPGLSVAETVRRYQANRNVIYAEPDFVVEAIDTAPNDPMWGSQWDMVKISAPTAWAAGQIDASDVVVAIIDTGIDFTHRDLAGNVDSTHSFTCIGGSCVAGGLDDYGHGTHVAGTIGAATNNGTGIAGINWAVKMISLKFLDSSGSGYTSDAVNAFNKIAALKKSGLNVRLTNNSWGGGENSQALKDAMLAVESLGIVNVCAAGNSGLNADLHPMYPAAYDNRGIISVLATDASDNGAGFSNYGMAGVDIAAPGVSTLSTVPTGSCPLCDPSGYKLLSGTSMATPHVSGVVAAMMHRYPSLSAAEARDIILDPGSYDTMTDARAQSTSTGGRLNFAKTIANTRLGGLITLNHFPTVAVGPNIFASAGNTVGLSATVNDPDNNPLRMLWSKSVSSGSTWLFGWMVDSLFPSPSGSSFSFTAPSLARTASVPYDVSVADNRGGGAHARQFVTISPGSAPSGPPTGLLSLSSSVAPVGSTINVSFPVTDPQGTTAAWDVWATGLNGSSGFCCYTSSSVGLTFNSPGVYRITVQAIDKQLELSTRQTAVVTIGTATGTPPIAAAALDRTSGPVPLSVNIDMSGSYDPDGSISSYYIGCGGGAFTTGSNTATGTCTFTTPGTYWLLLQVRDNSGLMDLASAYVVATPWAGDGDMTAPTVSITAPGNDATISGPTTVTATASDTESGVAMVDFRLDDPNNGTLIGSVSTSPYSFTWNPGNTAAGSHIIYAKAADRAGNIATSPGVSITIPALDVPTVSISISPSSLTPARKSNVTIAADVNPVVNRVEFYINGTLASTDTQNPFSYVWKVPNSPSKTYTLSARAYNSAGRVANSNTITVTSK